MTRQLPYEIIRPSSHQGWLDERNKGIGSSEAGAVCGFCSYEDSTPVTVWERKTGRNNDESESDFTRAGHEFEPLVAYKFALETGAIIDASTEGDWIAADREKPWLRVSPDRLFYAPGTPGDQQTYDRAMLLEIKTARWCVDPDNLPKTWYCQVQYQMRVLHIRLAVLAYFDHLPSGALHFGYTVIKYDAGFVAAMESMLDSFWNDNVLANRPPEMIFFPHDARTRWSTAVKGKSVVADAKTADAVKRYRALKDLEKEHKAEMDSLTVAITSAMGDAELLTDSDGNKLASWGNRSVSGRFQVKKFEAEHPELYDQYKGQLCQSRALTVA